MAREYIENVSYGFYGARMDGVQRMQRLFAGGFKQADLLVLAYAVMMGESGGYLKAFHHNTERNDDGTIRRWYQDAGASWTTDPALSIDGKAYMKIASTDLGFIQKNTTHNPARYVEMTEAASKAFVDELFEEFPALADGWASCIIAWQMYNSPAPGGGKREFDPWVAYDNGGYKKALPNASVNIGRFMAHKFIANKDYVIANPKFLD